MNTLLVNNGAARKLRSLFFLLFMVGVVNVASAATYYTGTTGTATVSAAYAQTGLFTNIGASSAAPGTITSSDVIIVQGAALTYTGIASGGVTVSSGTANFNGASLAFSGPIVISGGALTISIAATQSSGDLTISSGTLTLTASLTITGNVIMTGGTIACGSQTLSLTGNFGGNATATVAGAGTITSGNNTGGINFSGAVALLGTGASRNVNAITLGTSPAPQKFNAVLAAGSANAVALIRITGYVQLQNNSTLPSSCRIVGSSGASLLDLNGYTLTCGNFTYNSTSNLVVVRGGTNSTSGSSAAGPNSAITLVGGGTSNFGSGINFDNSVAGVTNLVNINMGMTTGNAASKALIINNNLAINSTPTTLTSASSSGTTVTCASTTGLFAGSGVTVTSGTGAFAANTTITSITNSTQFVVSATPSTALSGATISASSLGGGIIYLNGKTVTSSSFPRGNANSFFAEGTSANPALGGTLVLTSPASSGSSIVPIGTYNAAAVYTPVTFSNTTGSPTSYTVGVTPLNSTYLITNLTGCSSSGTTITCTGGLTGLSNGATVAVASGTGAFAAAGITASGISGNTFTVGTAPGTALSGATIAALVPGASSNVYGDGTANSTANALPYQWNVTTTGGTTPTSQIAFQSPAVNTGFTTSGGSTASLGVLVNGTTGYANVVTTSTATPAYLTTMTVSGSGPYIATTPASYKLYNNALANSYVVGNTGTVYPAATLGAVTDPTTVSPSSSVNIPLTGTNIASFTSSGLPAWLTINNTNSTTGSITGTAQATPSSTSITVNAINISGPTSRTFTYVEGNFPNIISSSTATALIGGTSLNYTLTTSSTADLFAITSTGAFATLPSGMSLNTSNGVISGTPDAGTAGTYSITITATNTGSGLSNSTPFTLSLLVLDVPTVTTISPATSKVDTAAFTITVNGTNFVSGSSTVTWAGSNLTTTFVSSTQLTASVSASLVANNVLSSTISVVVKNSGTNTSPTTPSTINSNSNTATYTITVPTPTITNLLPISSVVGAQTALITVTGTNFMTGVSQITFNGSTTGVTTTFVSATSLTATLSSTLLATAGAKQIGVTNTGAGLSPTSATTSKFTVYNAGAVWPFSTNGSAIVAGNIGSTSTLAMSTTTSTNILPINSAAVNTTFLASPVSTGGAGNGTVPVGLRYTPSISGAANTWPSESVTTSSSFVGINSTDGSSRYIQFDVTPQSGYNFTVSNISIPFTNNTHTSNTNFTAAYSFDGFSTYTTIGGSTATTTTGLVYNYSYSTPIVVRDGTTMSVRIIPKSSTNSGTASISVANVVIGGNTTAYYNSPSVTSSTADVSGDQAVTYTAGSPLYTFAATTVSGNVPTYSASGLAGTGYSLDPNTGKVTGKYVSTSGGTFNVTFTADNGNLFPTSTTVTFNIDGVPLQPTVTSISPSTATVDGAQFTLTVNSTDANFISGKSTVTWTVAGTPTNLATTFVSSSQLTAIVPAALLAGSNISSTASTATVGVNTIGATPSASTTNQTFTINNLTPSIIALSPAGINAGNAGFTLSVYGTNFSSAAKITWAGTQLTTTFVNNRQLTATISSSDVASVGTVSIGVTNVFPGAGSTNSASTINFIIGNATATWSTTSLTPSTVGSIVGTNTTLTGVVAAATGGVYSFGQTSGTAYSGDGGSATFDATFSGISVDPASTGVITSTRSIDFKVSPGTNKDMTISAITLPMYTSGNAMYYALAYSKDGAPFTKVTTASNSAGLVQTPSVVNTNDVFLSNSAANGTPNNVVTNYVFPTPITVANGSTLTFRVIVLRKGGASTSTVNIGPVSVVGNTTAVAVPDAPSITTLDDGSGQVDVSFTPPSYTGTSAITSYRVYAYANGSGTPATSATANVVGGITPTHILVTGLTNNTVSYTFKVSATNASGESPLSALSTSVTPSNNTTWTVTNGVGSWDHGDPDAGDQNATINGNYTLTKALNCLKLTVANNVTVALGNFNFTVQGNLVNNGTISGNGTLILASTSVTTITGTGTVGNVSISNSSGGVSVTTGNMFNVNGVLTMLSGTLTTNSCLTFKSTSITNTGILAPYGASGNSGIISGNVIVERYIPAGYRSYRDLAPGVNNAGSIFNNWQEGGAFTSGKGIFITGPGATDANVANYATQPAPNATTGLDYSIKGLASAFTYNNTNGSWKSLYAAGKIDSVYNTKTINLEPFTGYRVLVRGDRSFNLATTQVVNYYGIGLRMVNATTLRATGSLVTGTVTYATNGVTNTSVGATYQNAVYGLNGTTNKFSMIANPYVAPVQWGTGSGSNSSTTTVYGASSNINGSYWYMDPTSGDAGKFIAFNALTGAATVNGVGTYTSTSSITSNGYIQPGQAIFVQTTGASPTVVFKETAKATSASVKSAIFGVTAPLSKIYISLLKKDTSANFNRVDGAAIAFSNGFGNTEYGPQDALKFDNANDNLSISDKGKSLSIDGRLPATATDKLPLIISNISGKSYQIVVDVTNYITNGFAPYLVDNYKGTSATLTSGVNTISFTADASIEATFANRFSIAFKPTTLAVNSIVASATLNNKIATISWNTVGEKGVSRFEVEKSTDAKNFVKIGQASAKNTATASYTSTDNSVSATTYYRVKAINEIGTVSYSNVAQLTVNSKQFTVYPNPFVGKTLSVTFGNISTGKYTVTINNVLGQRVQEVAISHAGGTVSHAITVNNKLAAGNYSITIRETASGQLVHQTNLSVQP